MMTGMAVSNSILIVEFVGKQREEGRPLKSRWRRPAAFVCGPF